MRCSTRCTARISPLSPTSPAKQTLEGILTSIKLKKSAKHNGQVDGRVFNPDAACEVEKHVVHAEKIAAAFFQNSQQHREAAHIETRGRALRGAEHGLDTKACVSISMGRMPFHRGGYGAAAEFFVFLAEQQFGRVAHFAQSGGLHLVNAHFVGTAKAVFQGAQDAVGVVPVALKLQHTIHDVFQQFRSGDVAFFVDVADEENGHVGFFGKSQEFARAFAHLCDAARRGVEVRACSWSGWNRQSSFGA
jgi:hypothetical protein